MPNVVPVALDGVLLFYLVCLKEGFMNKKAIVVATVLFLALFAIGAVFAQSLYFRPNVDWSGNSAWAVNPNPAPRNRTPSATSPGTLTNIQLCIYYKDGSGITREYNTEAFTLVPGERKDFSAPGPVVNVSTTTCEAIR